MLALCAVGTRPAIITRILPVALLQSPENRPVGFDRGPLMVYTPIWCPGRWACATFDLWLDADLRLPSDRCMRKIATEGDP